MNIQDWFPLGWTGWISLHSRDSQEFSPASWFESINSLVLNLLYGPTLITVHDYWKNHSFDCSSKYSIQGLREQSRVPLFLESPELIRRRERKCSWGSKDWMDTNGMWSWAWLDKQMMLSWLPGAKGTLPNPEGFRKVQDWVKEVGRVLVLRPLLIKYKNLLERNWFKNHGIQGLGIKKELESSLCIPPVMERSSVQFSCSVVSLFDPMDHSTPGLSVHRQLINSHEFTQTYVHWVSDAIQPSHPLSSPFPPAFTLFQHQGLFRWLNSLHQVAKMLEF